MHLSKGLPYLHLRKQAKNKGYNEKANSSIKRRARAKSAFKKREAQGGGEIIKKQGETTLHVPTILRSRQRRL